MYGKVLRNMGEQAEDEKSICIPVAGLLHDIGHGPLSHTLEDISAEVFDKEIEHETFSETRGQ